MDINIEFARKTSLAYNRTCKSLCQELKLPQTAFDILMFLANNPEFCTARDIVEVRKLKANLVSVNVDKLVTDIWNVMRSKVTAVRPNCSVQKKLNQSLQRADSFSRILLTGS